MPDLFPRENKHGHVCLHQGTVASWKRWGTFILLLLRVMGNPAGVVTRFTKKEATFWQVFGRPSNKIHFPQLLSHPFEMQVASKQHEIPGNFLCPFNKSALWRRWLSLFCPRKPEPTLATAVLASQKNNLPQVPSLTPISLFAASMASKRVCVF